MSRWHVRSVTGAAQPHCDGFTFTQEGAQKCPHRTRIWKNRKNAMQDRLAG
ncbi:hypothetical protein thalar_00734 [Litoreibacter arenae DSM 19593]|uniref:Uncharacterized protein n=1 Tax=Litoreibacter arenae DSM 19593 TaxID=1123360 RepID=S9S528_9RHOB|nr:hypothetical protein thalar_00734 [Litoreibacter arenae DSM 19593]